MIAVLAAAAFLTAPASADHRPGNVVVIGNTLSLTGRYAEPADRVLKARKLHVEELNARGGLLGHCLGFGASVEQTNSCVFRCLDDGEYGLKASPSGIEERHLECRLWVKTGSPA